MVGLLVTICVSEVVALLCGLLAAMGRFVERRVWWLLR